MKEIVIVKISGPDRPGLLATLIEPMAEAGATVLDIGQAVIHSTVSLGILLEVAADSARTIIGRLRRRLDSCELAAEFEIVSSDEYARWVARQGQARHIVTLLARRISAEQLAGVAGVLARNGLNIDTITRLSGRVPLDEGAASSGGACVELAVRGMPPDQSDIRRECLAISSELGMDISVQEDNLFRRNRRLVALDMDSTLIEQEVIDELAQEAGTGAEVAAITVAAMKGEMDFAQSFRKRVALLKGLDEDALARVNERITLSPGAERLVAVLHGVGYRVAILSGGIDYFAERLARRLGIERVFANRIEIVEGVITGRVLGEIIDGDRKAALLRELAASEWIALEQVVAVGDGANDIEMLSVAGLGIAFKATPLVRERAGQSISTLGLDSVLYLLGLRAKDSFAHQGGT